VVVVQPLLNRRELILRAAGVLNHWGRNAALPQR